MKSKGFTLIELIVVIVILGILAATAAPKFINLEADAHTATLQAVKASMEGASALVYGKAIVKGIHNEPSSFPALPSITIAGGVTVYTHYGYPLGTDTEWKKLIDYDTDAFSMQKSTDSTRVYVYRTGDPVPTSTSDACIVHYTRSTGANTKPIIGVNKCN
ncbi:MULTISPECIES: prepilin-type N-terminal cleavage/methylation domain-containing protein [Thalassotalea]|uniref:Prepilin-type N-terminal cleavage/methylation domain-containing protein n=1 Tax=Thalassotalea castellviae TaxID=3075612 RepID=A0ABU2ZZF3_9GAMM|nr:prepilin-type N-terminal cleavage/methylation domain-containing protein [Thalassotalea sp. W431]MDT0603307.1 prepilin-type N-terminal cleavage/methylation domain-containing protein [Thalassotalea sp. W431]